MMTEFFKSCMHRRENLLPIYPLTLIIHKHHVLPRYGKELMHMHSPSSPTAKKASYSKLDSSRLVNFLRIAPEGEGVLRFAVFVGSAETTLLCHYSRRKVQ